MCLLLLFLFSLYLFYLRLGAYAFFCLLLEVFLDGCLKMFRLFIFRFISLLAIFRFARILFLYSHRRLFKSLLRFLFQEIMDQH